MTTTSKQAHSQLIVTIGDHRSMGQADKTSELDACTICEKNDANNSTIHVAIATKALIVI